MTSAGHCRARAGRPAMHIARGAARRHSKGGAERELQQCSCTYAHLL